MGFKDITCVRCREPARRMTQSRSGMCLGCMREHGVERTAAVNKVQRAIRLGLLTPARDHSCSDCGAEASQYDHRDYCEPLRVAPVCRSCNQRRGVAFDSKYRPGAATTVSSRRQGVGLPAGFTAGGPLSFASSAMVSHTSIAPQSHPDGISHTVDSEGLKGAIGANERAAVLSTQEA